MLRNLRDDIIFGKIWENLGKFGKIWENLGKFGKIWVNLGQFWKYCTIKNGVIKSWI